MQQLRLTHGLMCLGSQDTSGLMPQNQLNMEMLVFLEPACMSGKSRFQSGGVAPNLMYFCLNGGE